MIRPKRVIPAQAHGSFNYAELAKLRLDSEKVIDFSSNLNPYGPSREVRKALFRVKIDRYPDSSSSNLRQELARIHLLRPENIVCGNGSTELIHLIALTWMERGSRCLTYWPTFGEYAKACSIAGGKMYYHRLSKKVDFRIDIDKLEQSIREVRPHVFFLCNPNNPAGGYLTKKQVSLLVAAHPNVLFILDEAYADFVEDHWDSVFLLRRRNVILLRSMTKSASLAGLRIGYCMADKKLIDAIERLRSPWNVNAVAQTCAIAALKNKGHWQRSIEKLEENKKYLIKGLHGLGFKVYPGAAMYLMIDVCNASEVKRRLLRNGICVRDCTSFGLPEMVRVSVQKKKDCARLLKELKEMFGRGSIHLCPSGYRTRLMKGGRKR